MVDDAGSANCLMALVRDPSTFFVYWDVSPSALPADAQCVLRLSNLANGATAEIAVQLATGNWYVAAMPGCTYEIELGWRDEKSGYHRLASAGQKKLPPQSYSQLYDRQWLILEEDFLNLLRLCWFGFLGSSDLLSAATPPPTAVPPPPEIAPQPSSPGVPQYAERR